MPGPEGPYWTDLALAGLALRPGTALDGEAVIWRGGRFAVQCAHGDRVGRPVADGFEAGGQLYLAVVPHDQGQVLGSEPGPGETDDQTVGGVGVADFHPAAVSRRVRGRAALGHDSFEALRLECLVTVFCHVPVVGCRYGLDRWADLGERGQARSDGGQARAGGGSEAQHPVARERVEGAQRRLSDGLRLRTVGRERRGLSGSMTPSNASRTGGTSRIPHRAGRLSRTETSSGWRVQCSA